MNDRSLMDHIILVILSKGINIFLLYIKVQLYIYALLLRPLMKNEQSRWAAYMITKVYLNKVTTDIGRYFRVDM